LIPPDRSGACNLYRSSTREDGGVFSLDQVSFSILVDQGVGPFLNLRRMPAGLKVTTDLKGMMEVVMVVQDPPR
jgi:hypothetical protein